MPCITAPVGLQGLEKTKASSPSGEAASSSKRAAGMAKPFSAVAYSQTGVVCPYVPVLAALTNAGVKVSFDYNPKKIPAGKKKYLRALSASPFRATLTMKVAGGKEIDAVAGLTVLFEDNGAEKNLTNFEMTGEKGVLCGELGPLLGYIPGLVVKTDDDIEKEAKVWKN